MPTVIALDVSLSMTRPVAGVQISGEELPITYHQLAIMGIGQLLDRLSVNSKVESVSLMTYSSGYEVIVDFTRDYSAIRRELPRIEAYDKTCLDDVLMAINNILLSSWGTSNFCQVIMFTDCGLGFGSTSLPNVITKVVSNKVNKRRGLLPFSTLSKLNFICLGVQNDHKFKNATKEYQKLLKLSGQEGNLYIPKTEGDAANVLTPEIVLKTVEQMYESNFNAFHAKLICGGDYRLKSPVTLWPTPQPFVPKDLKGSDTKPIMISQTLQVCGYVSPSDIGSPMTVSRHAIIPRKKDILDSLHETLPLNEVVQIDQNIRSFFSRVESSGDEDSSDSTSESGKDNVCALLHNALKMELMAALVLLGNDWFGLIYTHIDLKKKSNLVLIVLQPGHDAIPWLGDLRCLAHTNEFPNDETLLYVKSEKRSYSQNCVVWIKQNGLQSDVQKILRHAKKLPEKTQHFYKELNRVRRAALSLGFVELLEGISVFLEREIRNLPGNANPDCAIQLNHSICELRKTHNRDLKVLITPYPTQFNQL